MKIEIITPQFHRNAGDPVSGCSPEDWDALKEMDRTALRELGLRMWNAPEDDVTSGWPHPGMQLLLFPGEWFSSIPDGFEIVNIMGERRAFVRANESDDIRGGCLAYGILRPHG